jgi:hypothetical protein
MSVRASLRGSTNHLPAVRADSIVSALKVYFPLSISSIGLLAFSRSVDRILQGTSSSPVV